MKADQKSFSFIKYLSKIFSMVSIRKQYWMSDPIAGLFNKDCLL